VTGSAKVREQMAQSHQAIERWPDVKSRAKRVHVTSVPFPHRACSFVVLGFSLGVGVSKMLLTPNTVRLLFRFDLCTAIARLGLSGRRPGDPVKCLKLQPINFDDSC